MRTSAESIASLPQRPGGPVRAVLDLVLCTGALLMVVAAAAVVALPLQLSPVLSGSMSGTFEPGALLVSRPVPAELVRPGDVIVFTPPDSGDRYAHRIVDVEPTAGGPVVVTRGDANPAPDPWRARLADERVPRVVTAVPHAGRLLASASAPDTRAALIALAGLLLCVTGTRLLLGPTSAHPSSRPPSEGASA